MSSNTKFTAIQLMILGGVLVVALFRRIANTLSCKDNEKNSILSDTCKH